jgi:two-component system nitrogen regulation response regulator NtrX
MAKTVLVVDDEDSILFSIEGVLSDEGFDVVCVKNGEDALDKMQELIPDIVLLDIFMPDGIDGIETLVRIKKRYPMMPVIMMSGHGTIETAVKATKLGAYDFIEKPISLDKLILSINNAIEHSRLKQEIDLIKEREESKYRITGHSESIKSLREQISIVAPTDACVLITGENGTGKELVAHTIHRLSRRKNKPMIEVNCAAIPDELIESELFGYEKGAFTGANSMKKGKFDFAHEGSIFLDEIGDMSLKAQSKILRILQEKRFERVGGNNSIEVDVRVIAATNKNLEEEIKRGRFREDLYFRLNVVPIRVPPLRERVEDIPELVNEFVKELTMMTNLEPKSFSEDAINILKRYNWPGDVRELKNLVERLMIMTRGDIIKAEDIPPPYNSSTSVSDASGFESLLQIGSLKEAKNEFERLFIENKLKEFKGNISQTAEAISVERSYLHKKIKTYGLNVARYKGE